MTNPPTLSYSSSEKSLRHFKMPATKPTLHKRFTMIDAERRFNKACKKVVALNKKIRAIKGYYQIAKRSRDSIFHDNMKLRLAVLERTRDVYFDYAYAKAEVVKKLRRELQ